MKALYLDPFAGISGNMLLGALIDAGFPLSVLREELARLPLSGYRLASARVSKLGIDAEFFDVELPGAEGHWVDAGQGHSHGNDHHHHDHHHHEHRTLADIEEILKASSLSEGVRARALKVFGLIAEAEGRVHGKDPREVHFHEVGAVDSIIDVVGNAIALEWLGIERIYTGTVTTGYGLIGCAHGLMPVPAPATAALLAGLPTERGPVAREMTTPTGAALLRAFAEHSESLPRGFAVGRVAYGAGRRDVEIPNVLRAYIGEIAADADATPTSDLVEAACNIDDMSGEFFAEAIASLLAAGALDAWAEPIVMKKGRPACKLCFLARRADLEKLTDKLLSETTTLGVRWHAVSRTVLERRFEDVATPYGNVTVKLGCRAGRILNAAPEFESVREAAARSGASPKDVYQAAQAAYLKNN